MFNTPIKHIIIILTFLCIGTPSIGNDPSKIYEQLLEKLEIAREQNDHRNLADIYFRLGKFEEDRLGDISKSFEHYTRSAEYFKLLDDKNGYYLVEQRIARQLSDEKNFEAAIPLLEEIIDYYKNSLQLKNLANAYLDLSKIYATVFETEKQNKLLYEIDKINTDLNDPIVEIEVRLQRINQYYKENRLDNALSNAFEVFKLSDEIDNKKFIGRSLYHIGYSNLLLNENELAVKYLEKSLEYLEFQPMDAYRMKIFDDLSKAYAGTSEFDKAYYYSQNASALNDSILNRDRIFAINNLTTKYETRKKRTEVKLLEKEKEFAQSKNEQQKRALYILIFGLGLLSLAIYYIVRFYTQRIKATRIITTQRSEISNQKINQLENKLKIKSMQSMIEGQEQERERIARDLHDSLGGLLSAIKLQFGSLENKTANIKKAPPYKKANELLDTAVHEVRFISQNLQPGALNDLGLVAALKDLVNRAQSQDGPEIDLQIYDMPKKLDNMIALNIYRIIQELLNNALKYAKASEILIQINRENKHLVILFEDDGIGFNLKEAEAKGMGMENIRSRINYLKGELSLDSRNNEGSSFMIHVEYDLNTQNSNNIS